jgi:hypothetical protein
VADVDLPSDEQEDAEPLAEDSATLFDPDSAERPRMMKISEAGLELISSFEGLHLTAYPDPVAIPTIGWGSHEERSARAGVGSDVLAVKHALRRMGIKGAGTMNTPVVESSQG